MWDIFKSKKQKALEDELKALKREKETREAAERKAKAAIPKKKKSPKEIATEAGEPYVEVVKLGVEPSDPRLGEFELDWNHIFIQELRNQGYPGKTDEDIIDLWFQDVCRNIILETYEQSEADISSDSKVVRYVNRKDLGDGKSEIS